MHISRRLAFLILGILLLAGAGEAWAQRTLLQCGTLLDPGVEMTPMNERTVIVDGQRVVAVRDGFVSPSDGDRVIDLRDVYCMPGLIDAHTHITSQFRKGGYIDQFVLTPADRALKATRYAEKTLMAGFTTIRDVGAEEGVDFALRDAAKRGDIVGPRMFVAGQVLSITGGHGDPTGGYREDIVGVPDETDGVVDGVASAIRGTRIAIKRGADHIKITATGGVLSIADDGSAPQFTEDEIRAIVKTARDHGLKVAAHAHGDEGMKRAIRAGVASIEHGTYMSAETMTMMKENGVYLVPTIIAGRSVADSARIEGYFVPSVKEKALEVGPVIQETFAEAYEAGVPIAFGTDAGVYAHGRNAKEFQYMVEAGMPAIEALYAATYSAADLLGQLDQIGTLESGKFADVVAVPRNPLDDITILQNVSFVMKAGQVYKIEGEPTVAGTAP